MTYDISKIGYVVFGVGILIAVIRIIDVYIRLKINADIFWGQIAKLLNVGNIERALNLCNSVRDTPVPRIIRLLLKEYMESDNPMFIDDKRKAMVNDIKRDIDRLALAGWLGVVLTGMGMGLIYYGGSAGIWYIILGILIIIATILANLESNKIKNQVEETSLKVVNYMKKYNKQI